MKIVKTATHWLFIVCFSLLLLTSTIHLGVTNVHIYQHGFDKYHISQVTGIDETQLSEVARRLVDYFNSEVGTPQIKVVNTNGDEFELFHDYELIHLQDVKGLFKLDYRIQVASLAYVIIYALLPLLIVILREHFGFAQCKLRDRRILLRVNSTKGKNLAPLRTDSAGNRELLSLRFTQG